ncbi:MAG: ABC transporter permease subunit [Nitriliruptorales bacterium]|nr:ABC transporter permease subunit [Nitriliruptorales bacterium]
MAVTTPDQLTVERPAAPGLRRVARYAAMPAFLALVCLLLFLYVSAQELDSIEARRLDIDLILRSVVRHLELVGLSTLVVIVLAVPLGILLTRPFARSITPPLVTVANTGQAIPSVGVVVLLALTLGFGFRYAVFALVLYAFLPVLRNTMVGLQQVDRTIIEAGRGMGMSRRRVLARIELPLAVPVMLAGVRTALVINVGTAAIAAITNAGGLGDVIYGGLVTGRTMVTFTGGILTATLALLVDWVAGIAEEHLRPRGL